MGYFRISIVLIGICGGKLFGAQEKPVMAQKPAPMRDLIIFNDITATSGADAIGMQLRIALCQEASPVLTSIHTLMWINVETFSQEFSERWEMYSVSDVSASKHDDEPQAILLIPSYYAMDFMQAHTKESSHESMQLMGFNKKNLKAIMTLEQLKEIIELYRKKYEAGYRASFSPLLIKTILDTEPAQKILWNIYLHGHGFYPYIKETLNPKTNLPYAAPIFSSKNTVVEFDLSKYDALIAGFNVREIQELVRFFDEIGTNFLYLLTCYSGGSSGALVYNALLIDSLAQIQQAGGAKKQNVVYSRPAQPSFTFVNASSFDSVTYSSLFTQELCKLSAGDTTSGKTNFNSFFSLLARYRYENIRKYGLSDSQAPTRYSDEELRTIIKQVNVYASFVANENDLRNLVNLPQVMFPGADTFTFFPMDPKNMQVITEGKVQAAEREHTSITIKTKEVIKKNKYTGAQETSVEPSYIFLSAVNIPTGITITGTGIPRFVSLLPGIALHTITFIDARASGIENMAAFAKVFPLIEAQYPKYFYIQHLSLKASENKVFKTFEDVLIVLKDKVLTMFFVNAENQRAGFAIASYKKESNELVFIAFQVNESFQRDPALSPVANVVNFLSTSKTFAPKMNTLYKELLTLEEIRVALQSNQPRAARRAEEKYTKINELKIDIEKLSKEAAEENKNILEKKIRQNIGQIGNLKGSPDIFILGNEFELLHTALRESFPIYKKLLEITGLSIHAKNEMGITLLMDAISSSNLDAIKFLLSLPEIRVNELDRNGNSALVVAASLYENAHEISKATYGTALDLLLEKGADPKQIQQYTDKGSPHYSKDITEKVETIRHIFFV